MTMTMTDYLFMCPDLKKCLNGKSLFLFLKKRKEEKVDQLFIICLSYITDMHLVQI